MDYLADPQNAVYIARQRVTRTGVDRMYRIFYSPIGEVELFSREFSYDELCTITKQHIMTGSECVKTFACLTPPDPIPDGCTGYVVGRIFNQYTLFLGRHTQEH